MCLKSFLYKGLRDHVYVAEPIDPRDSVESRSKIVQIMRLWERAYNYVDGRCCLALYAELPKVVIHVNTMNPRPFAKGNVPQKGTEAPLLRRRFQLLNESVDGFGAGTLGALQVVLRRREKRRGAIKLGLGPVRKPVEEEDPHKKAGHRKG